MKERIRMLFGFTQKVDRKAYAIAGFSLMLLKYVGEWALAKYVAGYDLAPLQFFNPMLTQRIPSGAQSDARYFMLFTLWTIPFVWIGVSMSLRRAWDAGVSPWWGLLLFVPGVNYVMMFSLCALPTTRSAKPAAVPGIQSTMLAVVLAALYGVAVTAIFTLGFKDYAAGLFVGVPLVMGTAAAFFYNRPVVRSFKATVGVSALSVVLFGGLLLIFALEGGICILMALPIAIFCAFLGATLGRWAASTWRARTPASLAVFFLLPFGSLFVPDNWEPPLYEIQSSVIVDAPREVVWKTVVAFPEITEEPEWYFRLGVAYPIRARLDGEGVGAVRHCEFSTGDFVEPITRWEPPARLSFDVKFQPHPMEELSPYGKIYAPHLDGYLGSRAGEFRLVELPDGKTRLEGSTWYKLRLHPDTYWRAYAETLIRRIHLRVLNHIKRVAELE